MGNMHKISPLENIIYDYYREVHSIRIACAFSLTFIVLHFLSLTNDYWLLATMITIMGPVSYLGNVLSRALERSLGTLIGALSGFIALYVELYSFVAMLGWCVVIMLLCGYLAQGKRPYMGLLIGITLCVVTGAPTGDFSDAIVRSTEAITGSILAIFFTLIYPQRAFISWRILMSKVLFDMSKNYDSYILHEDRLYDELKGLRRKMSEDMVRIYTLTKPANRETHISEEVFELIHLKMGSVFAIIEKLNDIFLEESKSHSFILGNDKLNEIKSITIGSLLSLSHLMLDSDAKKDGFKSCSDSDFLSVFKPEFDLFSEDGFSVVYSFGFVFLSLELLNELHSLYDIIGNFIGTTDND